MMGIEDEGAARAMRLPSLDDIESKLTSVSSKQAVKVTKSLGTVLGQALTADDTETIDWVLGNREDATITNTLLALKDPKLVSSLFKQIVIKFQSQDLGN